MNYFNYFTEIEEHFQRARRTGMFLLSPLDWAMIETWKESGVPLAAVQKGIDRTFEKWHSRKRKIRMINSLAYCAQEVLTAAREMGDGAEQTPSHVREPSFHSDELARYFRANAATLRQAAERATGESRDTCRQTVESLEQLAAAAEAGLLTELQAVEQRLTVLEDRLIAAATQAFTEGQMLEARGEMDRQLAPYRGKMTAEQLSLLEKQYLQRKLLEGAGFPRLSLFYL